MSYTPTNWQTGDTITAEKLNHMEDGIKAADPAGIVYVLRWNENSSEWQYHHDLPTEKGNWIALEVEGSGGEYEIIYAFETTENFAGSFEFVTDVDCDTSVPYGTGGSIRIYLYSGGHLVRSSKVAETLDYVVTLTPTAQDFSGTMDRTPFFITAAFESGKRIVFSIPSMGAKIIPQQFLESGDNVIVSGQIVYNNNGQNVLIQIVTSASDTTYFTKIFPLTPMS